MRFQPLTLSDLPRIRPYFAACTGRICDQTPGAAVMWRDYFHTRFAEEGGALYFHVVHYGGEAAFTAPIGSEEPEAFRRLEAYCREADKPFIMCMVPETTLPKILALYPKAQTETNEIWSDYLYDAAPMVTMAGRKLSGQRNHINKFKKLYADWRFEEIGPDNLAEARAFAGQFILDHQKPSPTLVEGDRKMLEVLDNYDLYAMRGGVLRVNGAVVGIALAEVTHDTLVIHAEKCLREVEGSYPMMVQCFAKYFDDDSIAYINREEDDGDPGLRTSKLSYHPIALLKKYTVRIS